MKNILSSFRFLVWAIAATGIVSCSDNREYPEIPVASHQGLPVSLSVGQKLALTPELDYGLYLFSRLQGDVSTDYLLERILLPLGENDRLQFDNEALTQREYRFLFTATPKDATKFVLLNSSSAPLIPGTPWQDIRLLSPSGEKLSIDNYYHVSDISGQDILATDTIHGNLQRIVGQMTFRFFKIGENINDLQPIDTQAVTSVFDRIKQIRITYENYTPALSFDAAGQPIPSTGTSSTSLIQTITPQLTDYRVSLPQTDLDTLAGGRSAGGEIQGYCFLPGVKNIRTTLVFTYYDTTPKCGDHTHAHTADCYLLQSLPLSIPKASSEGLSVEANKYTVNKAGIRNDRIIDITYGTNMDIETDWN